MTLADQHDPTVKPDTGQLGRLRPTPLLPPIQWVQPIPVPDVYQADWDEFVALFNKETP